MNTEVSEMRDRLALTPRMHFKKKTTEVDSTVKGGDNIMVQGVGIMQIQLARCVTALPHNRCLAQ